ncbi:hypothetical protein QQP08_022416 [Theobroma cacao]|nr:hypothetical protein QQP08_022416 [Theobroma cacao]
MLFACIQRLNLYLHGSPLKEQRICLVEGCFQSSKTFWKEEDQSEVTASKIKEIKEARGSKRKATNFKDEEY